VFARVSFFKGTGSQLDAAVELIRDRLEPSLRTQPGFLGTVTLLDRETGHGASVTYWQSAADMSAAEDMGVAARTEASERAGVQLTDVDRFERVLSDRVGPPAAGGFVRTTELRGSPEKVDDATSKMLDKGVPLLRSRKGYRAMVMAANRATGRILVSSIWDTAADREAVDQNPSGVREEVARAAGASDFRITRAEVVFSAVSQAAVDAAAAATSAT
jgi:heme-degrading monooxygenase HmoA